VWNIGKPSLPYTKPSGLSNFNIPNRNLFQHQQLQMLKNYFDEKRRQEIEDEVLEGYDFSDIEKWEAKDEQLSFPGWGLYDKPGLSSGYPGTSGSLNKQIATGSTPHLPGLEPINTMMNPVWNNQTQQFEYPMKAAQGGIARLGYRFGGHPGASHEGVGSGQTDSSGGGGEGQAVSIGYGVGEVDPKLAAAVGLGSRIPGYSDPYPDLDRGGGDILKTITTPATWLAKKMEPAFVGGQQKAILLDLDRRIRKAKEDGDEKLVNLLEEQRARAELSWDDPNLYGQSDYMTDYPGAIGVPDRPGGDQLPYYPPDLHPGTGGITDVDEEAEVTPFSPEFTRAPLTEEDLARINVFNVADGGRVPAAYGGIMDSATGRRAYGLGSILKKAKRAVKKIIKSPIGKGALMLGLGAYGLKGLGGNWNPFDWGGAISTMKKGAASNKILKALLLKKDDEDKFDPWKLGIGAASLGAGLYAQKQEDDEISLDEYMGKAARGTGIDIPGIRKAVAQKGTVDPLDYAFLQPSYYAAQGGRIGYAGGLNARMAALNQLYGINNEDEVQYAQEGGLMDMGGMEKDYRQEGGFVPIGGQERADDVPARLSKNEFVFTADAVRSAGGGDIDKGAEVMENVMENLERGGQVSEESQGLEGARNMFATAQRLEGVL
jgi:hypothetical protein